MDSVSAFCIFNDVISGWKGGLPPKVLQLLSELIFLILFYFWWKASLFTFSCILNDVIGG